MSRKSMVSLRKKMIAGFLTMAMVVSGIVFVPTKAEAAETPNTVMWDGDNYDIKAYRESGEVPVKEGYVFGGWYSEGKEGAYLTEEQADEAETAFAKFVPAYVLSVKAQNAANTTADTETTSVRLISSVDSKSYQKVGFDIWLANSKQLYKDEETKTPLETTKVYTGIMVGNEPRDASQLFGEPSAFVSVWKLTDVESSNFGKIIYVRPYWVTMDGTRVDGLAKYVHIEDSYRGYISIPVNLLTGEAVAAGIMEMSLTQALELADCENPFEAGRLLPEMEFNYDAESKIVKIVGNAENGNVNADGIYANVRFIKPTDSVTFDMTAKEFCKWDESPVTGIKAWDIQY